MCAGGADAMTGPWSERYGRMVVGEAGRNSAGQGRTVSLCPCTSVHVYIFIRVCPSLADMAQRHPLRCFTSPLCCHASQALDEARGDVDAAIEKVIEYLSYQVAEEGVAGAAGGEVEEGDAGSAVQATGVEVKATGRAVGLEGGDQAMENDEDSIEDPGLSVSPVQPGEPVAACPAGTEGPTQTEPMVGAGAEEEEGGAAGAREEAGASRTWEEEGTEGNAPGPAAAPAAPAPDASHAPAAAGCPTVPATSSSPVAATSKLRPVKTKKAVRVAMVDKKPPNR